MRKILAVVRREFIERVRMKWFWVMALLGPLFFGALFFLPALMARSGGVKRIVVVDSTTSAVGRDVAAFLAAAHSGPFDTSRVFRVTRLPAAPGLVDSLTAEVSAKRLDGFLLLTDALVDSGRAEYRAANVSALAALSTLESRLTYAATAARLQRAGVDPALVERSQLTVALKTTKIAGGKATGESAEQSFSLAYFEAIILYMAILLYGINVMSSVLEEKTTRMVEVLVSSLRPFQLMLGKVIGVGAVSIFQFLIWGVSARFLLSQRARVFSPASIQQASQVFQAPQVSPATAAVFVAYFLGGFFLYSSMFAAVGAMSSTEQEARQAQQPVAMLLVASFLAMFAMLNDPNSTLAVTLSMIPFTAPIAMPVRWAAGSLPVREVLVSLAILYCSVLVVTWLASRIYRVGILMTGKRPGLAELVRWIRTA